MNHWEESIYSPLQRDYPTALYPMCPIHEDLVKYIWLWILFILLISLKTWWCHAGSEFMSCTVVTFPGARLCTLSMVLGFASRMHCIFPDYCSLHGCKFVTKFVTALSHNTDHSWVLGSFSCLFFPVSVLCKHCTFSSYSSVQILAHCVCQG